MFRSQTRVGGELVRYPVCFSHDENSVYSSVGGVIKAHNVATGALQGEFRGHTARVTGVYLNPLNTLQLYSTSHDGTVRRWDPTEGICLQQYNLGVPVLTGTIAAGHHLYMALDPSHYIKFLPRDGAGTSGNKNNDTNNNTQQIGSNGQNNNSTNGPNGTNSPSTSTSLVVSTPSPTTMTDSTVTLTDPSAALQEITMSSMRDELRAKTMAQKAGNSTGIYICSFDLLTPQNATISTDFLTNSSSRRQKTSQGKKGQNGKEMKDIKDNMLINTTNSNISQIDSTNNPLQLLFIMKEFTAMARSRTGDLLVAVGGKEIHVFSKTLKTHGVTQHPHPITCVDIHPQQDLIAVGDITGRITLYVNASSLLSHNADENGKNNKNDKNDKNFTKNHKNLQSTDKNSSKLSRIVTSILHWHSHPVRSAKFSIDGNYLLSGGYEGVLVTWQLSNMTSHFLPRLSSFIQHISISPKGGLYALSCGDNSIQTLGAFNSQLKHVAHGVNILNPTNRLVLTSQVESLSDNNKVVLLTDQGHFQVFDVAQDLHICTFYLLDRNLLPENQLQQQLRGIKQGNGMNQRSNDANNGTNNALTQFTQEQQQLAERITTSLDITKVLVSPDGRWSCGFYQSPSKQGLRLWAHSGELSSQSEFVSRCVWNDQNNKAVISGTFSSNSDFLITGHADGKVRIWALTTAPDCDVKYPPHLRYMGQTWNIENTIEYQNLVPTVIVLSQDRTLLTVGFGNTFTLWSIDEKDGYNASFLFSHTFAGAFTEVISICFLPHYPTIYVATQHGLYTFDLLTLSCVGTYFCSIAAMVAHPTLPMVMVMAVVPHIAKTNNSNTLTNNTKKSDSRRNKTGTKSTMNDLDSDFSDDDEEVCQEGDLTHVNDYKGDDVDGLIAENGGVPPGATGSDSKCPIYRRLFKYLYRTRVINRYIDPVTKHIPSLRTLPVEKLTQAQKDLKVTLPLWANSLEQRKNQQLQRQRDREGINDDEAMAGAISSNTQEQQNKVSNKGNNTKQSEHLLTKPTKECCLLVFRDNRYDEPDQATSLFDVMLTKTKVTNTNNNPYNTSCYEASINLTKDFFIYLNRSRELTLIPTTPLGLSTLQKKSHSTVVQFATNNVLRDVYNLEVHSAKLEESSTLPAQFILGNGSNNNNNNNGMWQQRNPALDQLLGTLSNTPTHQVTSLASIFEQFMTPFLPEGK